MGQLYRAYEAKTRRKTRADKGEEEGGGKQYVIAAKVDNSRNLMLVVYVLGESDNSLGSALYHSRLDYVNEL